MPNSKLSHVLTAVAALSLTTLGTLAAPTAVAAEHTADAPAAAAACPWSQGAPPSNLNPYRTTDYAAGNAPVRMGPYGVCDQVTSIPSGSSVTVNCYVTNSYGNTWSYVRGSGWIYDANLRNGGSPYPCQF
ncbi:hypothetical protein ACGFNV_27910 [Streptomyces sp. NPDC048751]|uniref:hypothetical protein n=1 Tax=Streptomyces sp. NPDC048751 TaxID=3365591 RepID=UPI0037198EF7